MVLILLNIVGQSFKYANNIFKVGESIKGIKSSNYNNLTGMIVSINTKDSLLVIPSLNVLFKYPDGSFKTRSVAFTDVVNQ